MLGQIILKSVIVYFLVLVIMRFMGKREIGQLSLFDFVVLLLIADIAVIGIDSEDGYLFFIPIVILALIQKLFAIISLKLPFVRSLFDGFPSIIVDDGKLNVKEMRKQMYNVDDLVVQMRLKNIKSLSEVKYLILETNGELSIIKKEDLQGTDVATNVKSKSTNTVTNSSSEALPQSPNDIYPFPLIVSGKINKDNLQLLHLDEEWLLDKIKKKGYSTPKEIYYANYENGDLFIVDVI